MAHILGYTKNGTPVHQHPTASHSHRPDLDAEVIGKLTVEEGQTFLRQTIDLGRNIGEDHLVGTADGDLIAFARRGNRAGESRFVLNRAATPTTKVTIVACVDRDPGETQGLWCLVTLFEGEPGCREPWDASLKTEEAKAEAEAFWTTHALVPTEEERRTLFPVVNLTPHTVTVVGNNGNRVFPSVGVARATQTATPVGSIDGIELVTMTFGTTEGLPAPVNGITYIVSVITANAAKAEGRTTDDLVITADPVRDEAGRIIGCRRFARV